MTDTRLVGPGRALACKSGASQPCNAWVTPAKRCEGRRPGKPSRRRGAPTGDRAGTQPTTSEGETRMRHRGKVASARRSARSHRRRRARRLDRRRQAARMATASGQGGTPRRRRTGDHDADQARRRDLPGERLLRPLLRHLPATRRTATASRSRRPRARRPSTACAPATRDIAAAERCGTRRICASATRTRPQPQRLDSSATGLPGNAGGQLTCDQDHNYSDEQQAFDDGKMDRFVQSVGTGAGTTPFGTPCNADAGDGLLRRQHRHRRCGTTPSTTR